MSCVFSTSFDELLLIVFCFSNFSKWVVLFFVLDCSSATAILYWVIQVTGILMLQAVSACSNGICLRRNLF